MVLRRAALALSCLLAPVAALAADLPRGPYMPAPTGVSDTYVVTLSVNGAFVPSFPGSDKVTGIVYPALSFRRSDEPARFTAPDDGISISFLDNPTFRIGPVFRYQPGRYLDDDKRLFGLRKLDWDIESGLFMEFWPVSFLRARLEARHGFRGNSGFVGNFGIDAVVPYGHFTFSAGPRLSFGDDAYVQRYFGVTLSETFLNPRVFAYRPQGGITAVGALGAVTYQWNETWATTGYVRYDRLVNDTGASPIVRRIGSENQFMVGAKLSYSFSYTP